MKEYRIEFTCNFENYHFNLSIIPETQKAIDALISIGIEDIKKSENIQNSPVTKVSVEYTDDEGKTWKAYNYQV